MITEAINKLKAKQDLMGGETRGAFDEIMSGKVSTEEIGSFLSALRSKGETVDEITAAAKVMREKSARVEVDGNDLVDTCGTGGTGINTFNISTAAAFVAAGCGARVAKHGNRSASGHTGSADVLEALGVRIDIPPERVAACIRDVGIGFMFAPSFHSAMKYAAPARKAIGGRTIFNILGPLSNPAGAKRQVIGVYDEKLTETVAHVLKNLGSVRAIVVHGNDALDEITIGDRTRITELDRGGVHTSYVSPEDFGVKKADLAEVKGCGAKENARILLSVLDGERSPRRDIVMMNAASALVCAGIAEDFMFGMQLAAESIDSGAARTRLSRLIEASNSRV